MACRIVNMSRRSRHHSARSELIEVAARLLADDGPDSLSVRRVAAAAGTSTMSVYTHFGSMSGLIQEVVQEGFNRLAREFDRIGRSADPVEDLALYGRVYRAVATANAHLYSVMFGGRTLASFKLSEQDRHYGRFNLSKIVECCGRCIESGRFHERDAMLLAHHFWLAMHGIATLEIGGYLIEPYPADLVFETQVVMLMVGAGDNSLAASESVRNSAEALARLNLFDPDCSRLGTGRERL
ncbi:transcriptional regulator [Saccharomonospora marina XMU15]|uniref:Transcriptional regulator n=2 Tax=Saccharomonospora TaxID=1851 RepID=H5XBV3_9PSEU|nr:transcriptional regulator [Saccharomonospora marina XMU15]